MAEVSRWIVAVIAAFAIVALILFARGTPDRGDTEATPIPAHVAPIALTAVR